MQVRGVDLKRVAGCTPARYHCEIGTKLKAEDLEKGFCYVQTNSHVKMVWNDQTKCWGEPEIIEEPYIKCHIMSNAFHYGQACFEGFKVFQQKDGRVVAFNDEKNAERMRVSANRLSMESPPTEKFLHAIDLCVQSNIHFLPPFPFEDLDQQHQVLYESHSQLSDANRKLPQDSLRTSSFYIRAVLFGSGFLMGPVPSNEYTFLVFAIPTSGYYKSGEIQKIRGLVIDDYDRAAPKGVGFAKAAGNYAADTMILKESKKQGYSISLYLDAVEKRYVEEFNTSNFVGIKRKRNDFTPVIEEMDVRGHEKVYCINGIATNEAEANVESLSNFSYVSVESPSILRSITNISLMQIARDAGIHVEQRKIDYDSEIKSFSEVAAVGTAVILNPLESLTRGGKTAIFDSEPIVCKALYKKLLNIQRGVDDDRHGWCRTIIPPPFADLGQFDRKK